MAGQPFQVLLVEDNYGDVRLLRELLSDVTSTQFRLLHVQQLDEALKCLEQESFDVILLDLVLPDSQGIETFVKMHRQASAIPIIVFTGFDDETLAIRAMQEGAQDYLVKGQVNGDLLTRSMRYAIERQLTEEALRQSEERFRVALKNSPIVVFNQDRELRYTWVYNSGFGFTAEEILGKRDSDLMVAEDRQRLLAIKNRVLTTGIGTRQFVCITTPQGTKYYDLTVEPLRNESQEVVGITCAGIDISDRKESEEKIRQQAALLDVATNAILVRDLENRILSLFYHFR